MHKHHREPRKISPFKSIPFIIFIFNSFFVSITKLALPTAAAKTITSPSACFLVSQQKNHVHRSKITKSPPLQQQNHLLKSLFSKQKCHGQQGIQILLYQTFYNGLTEDGDFAMIGINVHPDEENENEEVISPVTETQQLPWTTVPLASSDTTSSISTAATSTETMTTTAQPPRLISDSSKTNSIQQYLKIILPNLSSSTLHHYTSQLDGIGFDPTCNSRFELHFEDLSFMKILHARFFYNEVMRERVKDKERI